MWGEIQVYQVPVPEQDNATLHFSHLPLDLLSRRFCEGPVFTVLKPFQGRKQKTRVIPSRARRRGISESEITLLKPCG